MTASLGGDPGATVSIVTVTYGNRWRLLRELLAFAESNPDVRRVVVVDNGAHVAIEPLVRDAGFHKCILASMGRNAGSAAGFKLGLETAARCDADWIWILDDDNVPTAAALDVLLESARQLDAAGRARDALVAFRPEHQPDIAAGIDVRKCFPAHSSFCRFHVADVPNKIWRRLKRRRPAAPHELPARISLPYSTYSGLFLHRSLLEKIGTPNPELVLYSDDTEFSHRIVKLGGRIWLLTDASLTDLERSWNTKTGARSSFEGWLKRGADFQVFYGARNRVYFDKTYWRRNRFIYAVNRIVFLVVLKILALRYHRNDRYELFCRATALGERGQLGHHDAYPLP